MSLKSLRKQCYIIQNDFLLEHAYRGCSVGSITSRCSGNEPALLKRAAEIEPSSSVVHYLQKGPQHSAIKQFPVLKPFRSQQNRLDHKHVLFLNFIRIICSSSLFHQCWSCDAEAKVVPHFLF